MNLIVLPLSFSFNELRADGLLLALYDMPHHQLLEVLRMSHRHECFLHLAWRTKYVLFHLLWRIYAQVTVSTVNVTQSPMKISPGVEAVLV